MTVYNFEALIRVSVELEAEKLEDAQEEAESFTCDGWLLNGDCIEISDISFVGEVTDD